MATPDSSERIARLERQLCAALDTLEAARPLAKALHQGELFTVAVRLLKEPGGLEVLYGEAPRFEEAGAFHGGDWNHPTFLDARFVSASLHAGGATLAVECLSELRFLAIAERRTAHPQVTPAYATEFLEAVLGHNVDLLFPEATEATRRRAGPLTDAIHELLHFLAERVGYEGVLEAIVDEAEARLRERPILVHHVVEMIRIAGRTLARDEDTELHRRARRLVAAVEGPTSLCRSSGTLEAYAEALRGLDEESFRTEARTLGDVMWTTGLVCPQHALLLRRVASASPELLPDALGLGAVGRASLTWQISLVRELTAAAVRADTAQCIYGLASLLECGVLFLLPVPREMRRLIHLPIHPEVARVLLEAHAKSAGPEDATPSPNAILVAGTLSVLGQPLGLGQGDNPTCQSARAISLWAHADAGYLLDLVAQAARDNDVVMHFEGTEIASSRVGPGMVQELHTELDPVSLVLVPHLDRIYAEMSRLVVGRGEDGHRWINPEFHGWWVERGFATTIDFASGAVTGFEEFVRLFYATHHPLYRGEAELTYPQPAGVAATDPWGGLLGWHAISIERVAVDPDGEVRIYFFNPNTQSRQRWGQGIETSTSGHGELFGESSLLFHEFAARLYLFHYNEREHGPPEAVPAEDVRRIEALARESWAAELKWR
jgi:hypothetical protein